jgi:hypothetical protein
MRKKLPPSHLRVVAQRPAPAPVPLPTRLLINDKKPVETMKGLRKLMKDTRRFFEHGGRPVHLVFPANGEPPTAEALTPDVLVYQADTFCNPVDARGREIDLPAKVAQLYLKGATGEWGLPPLTSITTAPILGDDGSMRAAEGYHEATGLWCFRIPELSVPENPNEDDARRALEALRAALRTFPFADAERAREGGVDVVRQDTDPGSDESAALVGLMTAVCRPSLWLAPGFLAEAAQVTGSGSGKGLLARFVILVAFGITAKATGARRDNAELEKTLVAALRQGGPFILLDNVNDTTARSSVLASVLTERPCELRAMRTSNTFTANSGAFIVVTGNGITITEDLARRFINTRLDPRCENAESRPFAMGVDAFLEEIAARRPELLTAALTIWRWGRRCSSLTPGKTLGGYEDWSRWCRDPLLELGCQDPVERIAVVKRYDPDRIEIEESFRLWGEKHGTRKVLAQGLDDEVKAALDPINRGRPTNQGRTSARLTAQLGKLVGTQVGGFRLMSDKHLKPHDTARYWLEEVEGARGARGSRVEATDLVFKPKGAK